MSDAPDPAEPVTGPFRLLAVARTRLGFGALLDEAQRREEAERLLGHDLLWLVACPLVEARRTATGRDETLPRRLAEHLSAEIADTWVQAGLTAEPRPGAHGFDATIRGVLDAEPDARFAAVLVAIPPRSMAERLHLRREMVARLRRTLSVPVLAVATPEPPQAAPPPA